MPRMRPGRPGLTFSTSCRDDHAAHAISAYGSRINQTPNLDRLAKDGMRFDRVFAVNSICTPEPGHHPDGQIQPPQRGAGVQPFRRVAADGGQVSASRRLSHRHDRQMAPRQRPDRLRPVDDPAGAGRLFQSRRSSNPTGRRVINGYVTDIITDLAIEFLKKRPKDKPFFLMCHHKAPHRNWEPDDKHKAMFADQAHPRAGDLARRLQRPHRCHPRVQAEGVGRPQPQRHQGPAARRANRRRAVAMEIPALYAGLPRLRPVGG